MSREVRRVPADWVHPKYDWDHPAVEEQGLGYLLGRYIGLNSQSHDEALAEWNEGREQWDNGLSPTYSSKGEKYAPKKDYELDCSWEEYAGLAPVEGDYMPNWSEAERTHYMMYETTSEGTPLSPAFATPEELARWLADTDASTFADYTATYEQWLKMIVGTGWAPSAIMVGGKMMGGVEAMAEDN